MDKTKFGYGWVLKFLLAAMLFGVGLWFIFDKQVVYTITGAAIVLFSVLRVVPLLKTLDKEVLRTINLIEIIFDFIIGGVLIYAALSGKVTDSNAIWRYVYKYGLAFVFYVRGVVFFLSTVFFEEKTEVTKFIAHLVFLTIGTIIATHPNFDHSNVAILLAVVAFAGTVYLSYDGYNGYSLYRNNSKRLSESQSDDVSDNKEIEAPGKRKEKYEDDRPYIN